MHRITGLFRLDECVDLSEQYLQQLTVAANSFATHQVQCLDAVSAFINLGDACIPDILKESTELIDAVTQKVIVRAEQNQDEIGAASYAYMELLGLTLYCFMWNRILSTAFTQLEAGEGNATHLNGLVKTADFFFARILPRSKSLAAEIEAGAETMMALAVEEF